MILDFPLLVNKSPFYYEAMFHTIKGRNITFDDKRSTATWNPIESGGLVFSESPLSESGPVMLQLSGTGAVELGIIWCDPATLKDNLPVCVSKLEKYCFLNDVKIHKRSCTMRIAQDDKAQEVMSSYGGGQYRQNIDCTNNYWVVADVKYGNIELEIKNPDPQNLRHQFSEVCGNNMKRLNDPACAQSVRHSPSSLCFSEKPVAKGQQFVIHCSPKGYQGTIPGRYYIFLRYTKIAPEIFSEKFADLFDLHKQCENQSSPGRHDWTQIEKFEKEDCTGNPVEVEYTGSSFVYKSSAGKRSSQNCRNDSDSQIWLVFELYGVSAKFQIVDENMRSLGSSSCDRCNRNMTTIPEAANETELRMPVRASESMLEVTYGAEPESLGASSLSDSFRGRLMMNAPYVDDPISLEKAIQKNFTKLRDDFRVHEFLDHMFESDIITRGDFEDLERKVNADTKHVTKKVLLILSSRPMSKKFMLNALEKTKQQFLTPLFFPEEEKE